MTVDNRVRHAIILAAGMGSRLRPYTDDRPKPLVEVNGIPILIRALGNLAVVGVEAVTIVVGYRQDDIRSLVGDRFGTIAIYYVEAPDFSTTGSAWSLWLARAVLEANDVLLLEGDVVFESALLSRIADKTAKNVTAVARFQPSMQGSAVTIGPDDAITEVKTGQTASQMGAEGPTLHKTINISRFSREMSVSVLLPHLAQCADVGDRGLFIEQVLQRIAERDELDLVAVPCDDLKWFEIDSPEDLGEAEALFSDQLN